MAFTLTPYTKPSHNAQQIVAKLQGQGLTVPDTKAAESFIGQVHYYRFRGYLYPYFHRVGTRPWQFSVGTTFSQAQQMYCFDEELRHLLFCTIAKIEVLLRTKLDTTMSTAAGHGFWYLDEAWFVHFRYPRHIVDKLNADFSRSKEEFAQHYHRSYYNQLSAAYKGLPPFWVISELTTLGQIRDLLKELDKAANGFRHSSPIPASTPLDKMAQSLGAPTFDILKSWIDSIRAVRNLCAHHSRLWNRNLTAPRKIDVSTIVSVSPVGSGHRTPHNTTYCAILVLRQICKTAGVPDHLKDGLQALLKRYPEAERLKAAMGVPVNWETCKVWRTSPPH